MVSDEAHVDELAQEDTTDGSKPIDDARSKDVSRTVTNLRFFADHAPLASWLQPVGLAPVSKLQSVSTWDGTWDERRRTSGLRGHVRRSMGTQKTR